MVRDFHGEDLQHFEHNDYVIDYNSVVKHICSNDHSNVIHSLVDNNIVKAIIIYDIDDESDMMTGCIISKKFSALNARELKRDLYSTMKRYDIKTIFALGHRNDKIITRFLDFAGLKKECEIEIEDSIFDIWMKHNG